MSLTSLLLHEFIFVWLQIHYVSSFPHISSHFLSFPQDDPNPVVAMDHVVPMTGYYCKVCHKFYHNEVMAKVTHCRSKPHSAKYEVRFSFFVLWVT